MQGGSEGSEWWQTLVNEEGGTMIMMTTMITIIKRAASIY